ncbi:hypothetical protein [Kibdelosporangium philippinense]|uniref:hypothetical protein n=1 Tax=Kibdelosporangium philippinense TaxID=211113 RepID=UPI003610A2DB
MVSQTARLASNLAGRRRCAARAFNSPQGMVDTRTRTRAHAWLQLVGWFLIADGM